MGHNIHPRRARPFVVLILLGGALAAAGCGATSTTSSTTSSAAATTTTTATSAGTSPVSTGGGPNSGALAFANCMRAHGVPNFPDPLPGGGFLFQTGSGVNPASTLFEAAQAKCQKLMPMNGLTPGEQTHPSAQALTPA